VIARIAAIAQFIRQQMRELRPLLPKMFSTPMMENGWAGQTTSGYYH